MAKRDLFSELVSGFEDLKSEREGKLTLKTTEVARPSPIKITADEIIEIRKSCNQSQAVFAAMLHTNVNTLRNWEQARSIPNAQAKVLLKMVKRDRNLFERLVNMKDEVVGEGNTATMKKRKPVKKAKQSAAKRKCSTKHITIHTGAAKPKAKTKAKAPRGASEAVQ